MDSSCLHLWIITNNNNKIKAIFFFEKLKKIVLNYPGAASLFSMLESIRTHHILNFILTLTEIILHFRNEILYKNKLIVVGAFVVVFDVSFNSSKLSWILFSRLLCVCCIPVPVHVFYEISLKQTRFICIMQYYMMLLFRKYRLYCIAYTLHILKYYEKCAGNPDTQ